MIPHFRFEAYGPFLPFLSPPLPARQFPILCQALRFFFFSVERFFALCRYSIFSTVWKLRKVFFLLSLEQKIYIKHYTTTTEPYTMCLHSTNGFWWKFESNATSKRTVSWIGRLYALRRRKYLNYHSVLCIYDSPFTLVRFIFLFQMHRK